MREEGRSFQEIPVGGEEKSSGWGQEGGRRSLFFPSEKWQHICKLMRMNQPEGNVMLQGGDGTTTGVMSFIR